jgi:hypothetical protein
MNSLLLGLALALLTGVIVMAPGEGPLATLFVLPLTALVAYAVSLHDTDRTFLVRLFFGALLIRVLVGSLIFLFQWQEFFGGDALTYDFFGYALTRAWDGDTYFQSLVDLFSGGGAASGWGMLYMVAAIYKVIGRNPLAVQFVNAVVGAASVPLSYLVAMEMFPSKRVARTTALLAAFFPSLVLWSSQGLKDGPIIFLLILSMLATLKLGNRFSFKYMSALALALCCLITLRFYVFYIVILAVATALILGRRRLTMVSFARQLIIMLFIGLVLAYFGVSRYATMQFEAYGSLSQLQLMRLDASRSAKSGFAEDVDVSTAGGALSTLPLGVSYLMLAPFPWQLGSMRQLITLPEMIVWWSSLPLLALGLWFTIKHRLREVAPVLVFTTLLTLAYSILQGNVGTAYRQRAQLLVFYFIFVAVGYVLVKEKREERARLRAEAEKKPRRGLRWGADEKDQMTVTG